MGFLKQGDPVSWEELQQMAEYLRHHAVLQFISRFNKFKDATYEIMWGDEAFTSLPFLHCYYTQIEYTMVSYDSKANSFKLLLRAEEFLQSLKQTPRF